MRSQLRSPPPDYWVRSDTGCLGRTEERNSVTRLHQRASSSIGNAGSPFQPRAGPPHPPCRLLALRELEGHASGRAQISRFWPPCLRMGWRRFPPGPTRCPRWSLRPRPSVAALRPEAVRVHPMPVVTCARRAADCGTPDDHGQAGHGRHDPPSGRNAGQRANRGMRVRLKRLESSSRPVRDVQLRQPAVGCARLISSRAGSFAWRRSIDRSRESSRGGDEGRIMERKTIRFAELASPLPGNGWAQRGLSWL